MEDILRRIINMDKSVAKRAEKAIEAERRLCDEQGAGASAERDRLVFAARKQLDEFVKERERALSEKLSKAEKNRAEQCKELDERFNSRRSDWKSEIVKRITEG